MRLWFWCHNIWFPFTRITVQILSIVSLSNTIFFNIEYPPMPSYQWSTKPSISGPSMTSIYRYSIYPILPATMINLCSPINRELPMTYWWQYTDILFNLTPLVLQWSSIRFRSKIIIIPCKLITWWKSSPQITWSWPSPDIGNPGYLQASSKPGYLL